MKSNDATDTNNKNALSKIGFIFVAAGAAVGIGNIWRFPYLVAQYDGGTFIFSYIFFSIFIGLSLMLTEFIIGRYLGYPFLDNIKDKLKYSHIFSKTVYFNLFIVLVLISFYFVVSGWTFYYTIQSVLGNITYDSSNNIEYYQNIFDVFLASPLTLIIFSIIVTISTVIVNFKGLSAGVEKINLIFLPILFILLVALMIKILSLDNATDGLSYIFTFNISKLPETIIPALGQALFSLSIGLGCMIIFASHTPKTYNLTSSAVSTVFMGVIVGIIASLMIIPAVVSFGYSMSSGAGLTFLTLPMVFSKMQFGAVFASTFFFIVAIAAFTSTLSMVETALPYIMKIFSTSRNKAIFIIMIYCFISNTVMCLSLNVWSDFKIFGLDLFNFIAGPLLDNILIIGIILIVFTLYFGIPKKDIKNELTNNGVLSFKCFNLWLFFTVFITPIIIVASVLYSFFG